MARNNSNVIFGKELVETFLPLQVTLPQYRRLRVPRLLLCRLALFRFTVGSIVYQLIPVAFSLRNFVAVFRIVERGIMVPWWRRWWFGAAVVWRDSQGTQWATTDRTPATVLIIRGTVAAILGSVLFVFRSTVCRVVVFGTGRVNAAVSLRTNSVISVPVLARHRLRTVSWV